MKANNQELETLQDIRSMMERSSRFISLSGWSGIAAGICALTGAFFAYNVINNGNNSGVDYQEYIADKKYSLILIATLTFIAAFVSATFFTYLKSKRAGTPIWSSASRRLMWSVAIPMIAGGAFILKIIQLEIAGLVAPGCLIFYGIALFCGSKQTLNDIKYLGYAEIILGFAALCLPGFGLYFWTVGFGLLHIIYGAYMWFKYERK